MENKANVYEEIIKELKEFYEEFKGDLVDKYTSRMALVSNILKHRFPDFKFVGFYVVEDNHLQISCYSSDILPHPSIEYGKGVCGTCWKESETIIVNDVKKCQNYIACDHDSLAEICLPVIVNDKFFAVFDIDSVVEGRFDDVDRKYLEEIVRHFI